MVSPTGNCSFPFLFLDVVCNDYAATFEKPPNMANSAKNILIGSMLMTVHAIPFALVQASLPALLEVLSGQSMAASTSE